jgi:hypothetical protein
MKIQVFIKNVYGNDFFYPKCEIAKAFSNIAKTKTLSIENLKTISSMGYHVQLVDEFKDIMKGILK